MPFGGIGLAVNALPVFVLGNTFGPGWEERKIGEYMVETPHDPLPAPSTQVP
jgi:hypothetical protein